MRLSPFRRGSLAVVGASALAGGAVVLAPPAAAVPAPTGPAVAQVTPEISSAGRLHPVTPQRILDTRESGGAVQAGTPRELVVLGRGGVPDSGVSAVVLNVTVTLGSERSDLQVYPVGQRPPQRTSNLNWREGETVPVQVHSAVGDGGRVAFSVHGGSAHVVVDVFGWYGDGSRADAGSGFTALRPQRLLDTRERGGAVEAGDPRLVQVTGNAGVPADATAVMLNATMLATPSDADLQVFPAGQRPEQRTSNLNVSRGQTRANAVLVPIGVDGRIGLSVSQGSAHVVLDVQGYYSPNSTERFVATSPSRVLDTRDGRTPVQAGDPGTPVVANRGGLPINASAAVLNVTATAASAPLDLQVYPLGERPARRTSTLNLQPGTAVPNLAVAALGTGGQLGLSPSQGSVHVILDVFGYFTSAIWSTCANFGWNVDYPGDWRTSAGDVVQRCSLFDPEPFVLRPGAPVPLSLAVQLRVERIGLEGARADPTSEQLSERQTAVDGRTAYRQERRQTEGTNVPAGTTYTAWLIDLGPEETLFATSYDVGEPSYDRKVAVLDEMMSRLDVAQGNLVQEVGRFETQLLGNPDRTHNIHLAADYIDGAVLSPGETFSLNAGIGERTRERGFREVDDGCIGDDGEGVDCVGGGISQLATTFMNVVWFTGLELVEFRQHSLYFSRYPVCHEATLSFGVLDVRMRNNSPYDVRIDTFYSDEKIGVRFVSRPWATVDSFARPQNPPSSGPFDSSCGRTITYPDGSTDEEFYTWRYDDTGF